MSRHIFEQLDTADQALRENLHRNDLDPTAREHMERASKSDLRLRHICKIRNKRVLRAPPYSSFRRETKKQNDEHESQ
jgi:hypothetical protein